MTTPRTKSTYDYMFKTQSIDPARYEKLKENGHTRDSIFDYGQHEDLKELLFGFGGDAVITPGVEPDKEKLMTRGVLVSGEGSILHGHNSACHYNASMNFKNLGHAIMTGYALSDDGVWRQHTWNVDGDGIVIETTEMRVAYFGFTLTDDESLEFADQNQVRPPQSVLDDDFEDREFILMGDPADVRVAEIAGGAFEIRTKYTVPEAFIGAGVWIIRPDGSGRYLLAGKLVFVETFERDEAAELPVTLSGDDFVSLEEPVEISDPQLIDRLKNATANERYFEIADDGPEFNYLLSRLWPDGETAEGV